MYICIFLLNSVNPKGVSLMGSILDSDDEKKAKGNGNRFGPLGQVCEINEKDKEI